MLTRFLFLALAVVFAAGCGVKAETYVMTKDRTDITPSGNAGYLGGTGTYQEPEKKTRKVYVLELSKAAAGADKKIKETVTKTVTEKGGTTTETSAASTSSHYAAPSDEGVHIPVIEDTEGAAVAPSVPSGPTEDTLYTVQKDDTLQKIAKKFYGSYGKWIQIYEANKDKLKNPNFVKPGTVITIPAGK